MKSSMHTALLRLHRNERLIGVVSETPPLQASLLRGAALFLGSCSADAVTEICPASYTTVTKNAKFPILLLSQVCVKMQSSLVPLYHG